MKISRFFLASSLFACLVPAYAQDEPSVDPSQLKPISPDSALKSLSRSGSPSASTSIIAVTPKLAIWQYQFVSPRDGNTYQGSIVGGNPFNRGGRTTNVPVVIVPVRVQFTGTVRNFDPTSPDDGCIGAGNTAVSLAEASPIFQPSPFTINGVNVGNTIYPDAFQRAAFWPAIGGFSPAYHLGLNVSVAPKQTISVVNGSTNGATFAEGGCSTNAITQDNPQRLGLLDINFLDPLLNGMITTLGIAPNQFPLFVLYGVVISDGAANTLANCCILGYHSTVSSTATPANPGQTYGIAEYDQGYLFGPGTQDVSAMSHEVQEWIDDPSGVNMVPAWGNIGQVVGCQGNLEVGDPLSGKLMPAITLGATTYHVQEMAFPQWFLGTPFPGAGGVYSSNGTFPGFAKACPPGGTN